MSDWRHVRLWALARLCQEVPMRLRWRWKKVNTGERIRLQVVSPRGAVWDFKLNGGAWLKPVPKEEKKPNKSDN